MQLQIFDLRGHLWVDQRGANNAFVASMMADSLEMLPNGVYLYVVSERNKKGEVIYSEVRKVVIVR
ncbi:hypothetical protein HY009_00400 [Candidatus Acetothermia bacterium]|nr:hypothetical protein [Candidatus Acetothermia bacterium]